MPNHKEKKARSKFYTYDKEGNVTGLNRSRDKFNQLIMAPEGAKGVAPTAGLLEMVRRGEGVMFEKRDDGSNAFSDFRGSVVVDKGGYVQGYKNEEGKFRKVNNPGKYTVKELDRMLERDFKTGAAGTATKEYKAYIKEKRKRNAKAKADRDYFEALKNYTGPTAIGAEAKKYEDMEYIKSGRRDQYKREQAEKAKAPVKKVSTPIRKTTTPKINMFNMKPKDQALGKFSYAAIQAKKAGKKSFEYAGKTFPVKKGTYGNTNKALYKAKMPAMYKLGVKALNKLDK